MLKLAHNKPVFRYNVYDVENRQVRLNPCGNCHGEAVCYSLPPDSSGTRAYVRCSNCGRAHQTVKGNLGLWTTMWAAMDKWDAENPK